MPIFDYQCRTCKKAFDVFYKSQSAVAKEEKDEKCPHCGSTKKRKTVSKGTTHVLKGNWFKQGY